MIIISFADAHADYHRGGGPPPFVTRRRSRKGPAHPGLTRGPSFLVCFIFSKSYLVVYVCVFKVCLGLLLFLTTRYVWALIAGQEDAWYVPYLVEGDAWVTN